MYRSTLDLKVDKYICLGDLCNYYSDNIKVIDFIIEQDIMCVLGNHDVLYISKQNLSTNRLKAYNYDLILEKSRHHINFLKGLPTNIIVDEDVKVLFCHGSPNDFTNEYIYPDSDLSKYANCGFDIVFCGHTHRQFLRSYGSKLFCNVGSVGLPRDNGSLLGFVIYDSELKQISLYRKYMDKDAVYQRYNNLVPLEVIKMLSREEKIYFPYILLR